MHWIYSSKASISQPFLSRIKRIRFSAGAKHIQVLKRQLSAGAHWEQSSYHVPPPLWRCASRQHMQCPDSWCKTVCTDFERSSWLSWWLTSRWPRSTRNAWLTVLQMSAIDFFETPHEARHVTKFSMLQCVRFVYLVQIQDRQNKLK